jgi:hypothetical protein
MLLANPEFLVINGASRAEAIVFAFVLAVGPPLAAVGIQIALGAVSARAAALAHLLCVWLFGFTALIQVLALLDPASRTALVVPAIVAFAGAVVYMRWKPLRAFLSLSVALPLLGLVVFLTTAPLALADGEGDRVAVAGQTPVVLVVLDEFPLSSILRGDGTVDAARYPGFGRLTREATWYPRATTVSEYTTRAVPAILTGRSSAPGTLPTLADHPQNLFTLLGASYDFRVREPVTRLCPVTYCPQHRSATPLPERVAGLLRDVGVNYLHGALPSDFHGNLSPLREGWGPLVEDASLGTAEFLGTVQPSDRPRTLYFLHTMQPHSPWFGLPSGRRYGQEWFVSGLSPDWVPGGFERWRDGEPLLVAQALQRHLLEVMIVDRFVQSLLDRLAASGVYDRALIVVTADHGASFRPGGWKRHATETNLADIAAVPLFVKYPGQRRGRDDRRDAVLTDVLPTIADVLRIRLPWPVEGRSLRAEPVRRGVRVGTTDGIVSARADDVAADVLRVSRRNSAVFGEGDDSVYRIGPRPDLLGRPVTTLRTVVAPGARVQLVNESELESVRRSSGYVPAHIIGRIDWKAALPKEVLAIVVNGRIAAVTTSFTTRGRTLFSSLVDERVLVDGRNTVDVFALRGVGDATRLHLLGGTSRASASVAAVRETP